MVQAVTSKPRCPNCEAASLVCLGCDDTRPEARELAPGWVWCTPFNEWQTVKRVESIDPLCSMVIYTEDRPEFGWRINGWIRVSATPPRTVRSGNPVVRVAVGDFRMYALAVLDTEHPRLTPRPDCVLVEAGNAGRGKGWWVHATGDDGEPVRLTGLTKAQARSEVRRRARECAKRLKVKLDLNGIAPRT